MASEGQKVEQRASGEVKFEPRAAGGETSKSIGRKRVIKLKQRASERQKVE